MGETVSRITELHKSGEK